jgi:RNA polymerase sigma-70 factor (ECF subfamily)
VTEEPGDITRLLWQARDGDSQAEGDLAGLVYKELHRIAERLMRSERTDHTLQPTALVNEAYVRLLAGSDTDWKCRAHFFGVAAQIMRRILVDYARAHRSEKRGGKVRRVELEPWDMPLNENCDYLIAVNDALTRLAEWDPRQSRIVELRFFVGLSEEEIAEVLRVSARTVRREWRIARAWLYGELKLDSDVNKPAEI